MALPTQTSAFRLLIVAAALLGALVVTHLGLQARADFANGCSGLAAAPVTYDPSAPAETAGCAAVTQSAYATTFGISQIIWGFVFYGLLVALRLGYAATSDDRLRLAAFAVNAVGLLFAAYLIYVMAFRIGAFCALCLTSHALTLTLLVLHFLENRRLRSASAVPSSRRPADRSGLGALRPYAPLLGLFAVLIGADVALAGRTAAEPADPQAALAVPTPVIDDGRLIGDTTAAAVAGACTYDATVAPISNMTPFTNGPFTGSTADDAVLVVEVFDPNCPHCRDLHEVTGPIAEAEAGRARFYHVPYPLRPQSVAQVIALKVAQREGKYAELVDEMFARQDQTWGMSVPELVAALNTVGMDGAAFQAMLEDQALLQPLLTQVQADAAAVAAAFQSTGGGISTPRVAIGGRVIAPAAQSYTADCFAEFITQAAAAQ